MARWPTARRARCGHRAAQKLAAGSTRPSHSSISPFRTITQFNSVDRNYTNVTPAAMPVDLVRLRKPMSPEPLACVADFNAELQA
jgi:hypothetical protein